MTAAVKSDLTCKELVELVTDYLEDRLSPAERRRFELHVRSCTGCGTYLTQMRAVVQAAGSLADREIPAGVREELLRTFREWKRA